MTHVKHVKQLVNMHPMSAAIVIPLENVSQSSSWLHIIAAKITLTLVQNAEMNV